MKKSSFKQSLLRNILFPLSRRIGTAVAALLVAYDVSEEQAIQGITLAEAGIGIAWDLWTSYKDRS